jgi:ABC-type transport system involved in multi-copper enzyme maturation permease subunit
LRTVAAFANLSFREAIRAKWLIIFTIVYFLVLVNIPFLILAVDGLLPPSSLNSYVVYLGSVSYPFLPLLSLPVGALSIVEEKEAGTLQYLFSTRLTRFQFLLGRYLGMLLATSLVLLGGFTFAGLVVSFNSNGQILRDLGFEAGLALLLNAIMLSLAITISALSRRKATALSIAIFTWFLLLILSDFGESFGLIVTLPNGPFAEVVAALINPIESAALISEMSMNAYGPQLGPTVEILKNYFGGPITGIHTAVILMGFSLFGWLVITVLMMFLAFKVMDLA